MALTVKRVAKVTKRGRYADGHGLYLQVSPAGVKSWLYRYERDGRERWMGLGPVHAFTLDEARALEAAKARTFQECATTYFDGHEEKWRNKKHRAQFMSTLRHYAFPKIGRLPVAEIDTGLVLSIVEPIWKTKTETANRIRNRIEKVLDWATVRGYRVGDNPARWGGHLSEVLPPRMRIAKTKHFPALPFVELPAFMEALRARDNISARGLEFTILTAARTSEVIGARWSEIDLTQKCWTVPANRIKGGREHRVPLSDRALAILKALPHEADFVFPGGHKGGGLSNMSLDAVLRRMGFKGGKATVHGFRSTFRDWAAERTAYPNHVVEMALAHTIGNAVEASYRRGDLFDKRRRLMSDWAKYCASKPVDASRSNIAPLRQRGAA